MTIIASISVDEDAFKAQGRDPLSFLRGLEEDGLYNIAVGKTYGFNRGMKARLQVSERKAVNYA